MTDPTKQGSHFWFMTIQTPNAHGYDIGSYQGAFTPAPGATRLNLFNQLLADVQERFPNTRGGAAIAFDIQPNKL